MWKSSQECCSEIPELLTGPCQPLCSSFLCFVSQFFWALLKAVNGREASHTCSFAKPGLVVPDSLTIGLRCPHPPLGSALWVLSCLSHLRLVPCSIHFPACTQSHVLPACVLAAQLTHEPRQQLRRHQATPGAQWSPQSASTSLRNNGLLHQAHMCHLRGQIFR